MTFFIISAIAISCHCETLSCGISSSTSPAITTISPNACYAVVTVLHAICHIIAINEAPLAALPDVAGGEGR